MTRPERFSAAAIIVMAVAFLSTPAVALDLGAEQIVQADGADIDVASYSVPCYGDWNGDGANDLLVGEGGGLLFEGRVRVYLNEGTATEPLFGDWFYAQSEGGDIVYDVGGCMGLFPRLVFWDEDDLPDLLIGIYDGRLALYRNIGTESDPLFGAAEILEVGPPAEKIEIDVGLRATPCLVDWNEDGRRDLLVGAWDGLVHLFINEGTDTDPDYLAETFVQEDGADLLVPTARSSPDVLDLDGDGKKDLLTGNTAGELLLYSNVGTNEAPLFSGWEAVEADGVPIDLVGSARSRPFLCDWTGDGVQDVLIGAGDGLVHLYEGDATDAPAGADLLAQLLAPWPNPFNPAVRLAFELEEPAWIQLAIYDVGGRHLVTLADGFHGSGRHELDWQARGASGRELPSGVYLARLDAGGDSRTRKITLLR